MTWRGVLWNLRYELKKFIDIHNNRGEVIAEKALMRLYTAVAINGVAYMLSPIIAMVPFRMLAGMAMGMLVVYVTLSVIPKS